MIRTVPGSGGWLEVVCGPMFSGKSEELIRRLRRAEIAGQRVLIVKPRIDDRFDVSHVVSHAGAKMRAVAVDGVQDTLRRAEGYDVVGVDEAQFFEPAIVDAVAGARRARQARRRGRARPRLPRRAVRPDAAAALPSQSSSTSCRPSATSAAARRRARSGSSTASPHRSTARRSRSARSTRTRRAAARATEPASSSRSAQSASTRVTGDVDLSLRRRRRLHRHAARG